MKLETGNSLIDNSTAEWVVGSDEVGYGCWAGPLLVVAMALPRDWVDPWGVTDSKKLSETKRKKIAAAVRLQPPAMAEVWVMPKEIDAKGVYKCLLEAHKEALTKVLQFIPGKPLVVVDGFPHGADPIGVPGAIGLPKADLLVPTVSLASIVAKTRRDAFMEACEAKFPGYGWASHKGYGTAAHQAALEKLGHCSLHRTSYAPIARIIRETNLRDLTEEAEKLGLY